MIDAPKDDPPFFVIITGGVWTFKRAAVLEGLASHKKWNLVLAQVSLGLCRIPLEFQTIWHSPMHCQQFHSSSLSLPVRALDA